MSALGFAKLCADSYRLPPTMAAGGVEVRTYINQAGLTIVFRGSSDVHDWIWNARVIPIWSRRLGCFVHRGFMSGVEEILPEIMGLVAGWNGDYFLTGHSKGGAEATLASASLCKALRPPKSVTTFGAPRVSFGGLSGTLAGVRVERYVNGADVVPRVPCWPYKHEWDEINVGEPAVFGNGELDPVVDHSIYDYIAALDDLAA